MGGRSTIFGFTILVALVLGLPAAPLRAAIGVPENGLDLVELDDGRVLSCKVGEESDGALELEFSGETIRVDKDRIEAVRLFKDFDPAPHDASEEKKVEDGYVRWDGKWLPERKVASIRSREEKDALEAEEENEEHSVWENRWIRESKNFSFESNIDSDDLEHFMNILEEFYTYFTKTFHIRLTQRERRQKLPVRVFRKRDEYMKFYETDTKGSGDTTLGYFVPEMGSERLVLFNQPGNRQGVQEVFFHEGTHFLLHLAEPQVLLNRWLHEGMATYFETAEQDGRKFKVGAVNDGRLLGFQSMVERKKLIPWDEFFRAGNPAEPGQGIAFRGPHYAQAWAVVHFLLNGKKGRYAGAFIDYINRAITGRGGVKYTPIAATERRFLDPDQDKALLFKCLKIRSMSDIEDDLIEYAMALPLQGATAYVQRGAERYWNDKDPRGAAEDFEMAEKRGAEDPKVLAFLARVYQGIPEKSGEVGGLYQRALELDPLNVDVRFQYARTLPSDEQIKQLRVCVAIEPDHPDACGFLGWMIYTQKGQGMFRAKEESDIALMKEARTLLEKSVELEPSHDKLSALAMLRLNLGDFEAAERAAERAAQLEAQQPLYRVRLAWMHAVLGKTSEAVKEFRRIKLLLAQGSGGQAEVDQQMRSIVSSAANVCLTWDKAPEALKLLDAWHARVKPDSDLEWSDWALCALLSGERKRAEELLEKGQSEFPDSVRLKNVQYRLDSED